MPSPFPGMNPYLEREYTWKDFHDTFLFFIRSSLVAQVRPHYIVKIGEYVFVHEPPADQRLLLGHADVSLSKPNGPSHRETTATAIAGPARIRIPAVDLEEHLFLEIRDRENHELVTVLEMLSPSNKKLGSDRDHYLVKRAGLLHSGANFVEIDLLRGWPKMPADPMLPCDYCIMVSRREERPEADFWPIQLRDPLPTIPIPLRPPHADASLDLQSLLHQAYDDAAYADYLYQGQPNPPLNPEDAAWAASLIAS